MFADEAPCDCRGAGYNVNTLPFPALAYEEEWLLLNANGCPYKGEETSGPALCPAVSATEDFVVGEKNGGYETPTAAAAAAVVPAKREGIHEEEAELA